MNYARIYGQIVERFRADPPVGYAENHHVVPRCMGGGDGPENIVRLPARYHFVAHLLLAKMHGGKMLYAAWRMKTSHKYTNREYDWLRHKISKRMAEKNPYKPRDMSGENNPMYGKKGSASPHFGRIYSSEHRKKISEGQLGKRISTETKAKIAQSRIGKKASEETKQKMRSAHLRRLSKENQFA